MEQEAVQLLNLVTGAEIEINTEQEVVNMCKALADMISRERKLGYDSGIEEGREEGREEGQREKSIQIIKRKLAHGYTHVIVRSCLRWHRRPVNTKLRSRHEITEKRLSV